MKHKWTLDELIDHWTVLPNDLELVNRRRTDNNRVGFAIVPKYFQIEGRFPRRRREVPQAVIEYVAKQPQVTSQLYHQYDWHGRSIKTHRAKIRSHLGFCEGTVADAGSVIWFQSSSSGSKIKMSLVISPSYLEPCFYECSVCQKPAPRIIGVWTS